MVKTKGIENIENDLIGNLDRDFNILVRAILSDLSSRSKSISPIDTGFFMSSWTAGTQRPRPDQPRESHSPWNTIRPTGTGNQRNPNAVVEPRFLDDIPNFKPFSKVFIGNRSEYAARALASNESDIPQYVQSKLRDLIQKTFTDKKPKLGIATFGTGVDYPSRNVRFAGGGIGQFADPKSVFVDYETP
tara:strand:+ start:94 stop:660 length:567 start_codon:yes stop_codon:yes gene_type:complete